MINKFEKEIGTMQTAPSLSTVRHTGQLDSHGQTEDVNIRNIFVQRESNVAYELILTL